MKRTISDSLGNVPKLNGTARPSLALEQFQEMENLKLSGSDRDEAENTLAGALGSIYAGQCASQNSNLFEPVLHSWDRYCKSMTM